MCIFTFIYMYVYIFLFKNITDIRFISRQALTKPRLFIVFVGCSEFVVSRNSVITSYIIYKHPLCLNGDAEGGGKNKMFLLKIQGLKTINKFNSLKPSCLSPLTVTLCGAWFLEWRSNFYLFMNEVESPNVLLSANRSINSVFHVIVKAQVRLLVRNGKYNTSLPVSVICWRA